MEQKIHHGGKWWDTLFIFIQDNDEKFILDFVERLPCINCKKHFLEQVPNYNLNQNKNELYKILWQIRCIIDKEKYKDKNDLNALKDYLNYLYII